MNTTVKVIAGVLLGTAIGVTAGVLVAPTSGNKTRKMIRKQSKKYSRQALELASDYLDGLKKGYNKKIDAVAQNGKSSIDSIKESIRI